MYKYWKPTVIGAEFRSLYRSFISIRNDSLLYQDIWSVLKENDVIASFMSMNRFV